MSGKDELVEYRTLQRQIESEFGADLELEPAALLQVLRRLTVLWQQPWDEDGWHANDPLNCPLATTPPSHPAIESVLIVLGEAARWPFFYRLNGVAQLATTRLSVCLDAGHTRLSHSLGAATLAAELLSHLVVREPIDYAEISATLVHAFLHDAFHGPLGHVLDGMAPIFLTVQVRKEHGHRKLDKALLYEAVRGAGDDTYSADGEPAVREIRRLVQLVAETQFQALQRVKWELGDLTVPTLAATILEILAELTGPTVQLEDRAFLREITDSIMDADRLDFIWRDSHQLNLDDLRPKVGEIIRSAFVHEEGERRSLRYSNDAAVRKFLEVRRDLYRNAYENERKLAVDVLIERALVRLLQRYHCISQDFILSEELADQEQDEIRWRLFQLTDADLMSLFVQLALGEQLSDVRILVEDITVNRAWSAVFRHAVALQDIDAIVQRRRTRVTLADAVEKARRASAGDGAKPGEQLRRAWHDVSLATAKSLEDLSKLLADEDVEGDNSELVSDLTDFGLDDAIYDLHTDLGRELAAKLRFEKRLWLKCRANPDFEEVVQQFARRRHLSDSAVEQPWLFLHVQPIPSGTSAENIARTHVKESGGSVPVVSDQKSVVAGNPEELSDRGSVGVFPFYVYLPPYLAKSDVVVKVATDTVLAALNGRDWFEE